MPRLPQVSLDQPLPAQRYPIAGPEAYGGGLAEGAAQVGEYFKRLQFGADQQEAEKIAGEAALGLDSARLQANTATIKNAVTGEERPLSPEEFRTHLAEQQKAVFQNALDSASNPRTRQLVDLRLTANKTAAQQHLQTDYIKKISDKMNGDFLVNQDRMLNDAGDAVLKGDNSLLMAIYGKYGEEVGKLRASDPNFTFSDSVKAIQKFHKDANERGMLAYAKSKPDEFLDLLDKRQTFEPVPVEVETRLREVARTKIEQDQRRKDKVAADEKKLVVQDWYSRLGTGQLQDSEIQQAIENRHPYINPQEGLQFQEKKQNGVGGEGSTQVDAIMADYYGAGRSMAGVTRTRAALNNLRTSLGTTNPRINKALNELQSDQTTLENQGISMKANEIADRNRDISTMKNDYVAWSEQLPPQIKNLLGNQTERNKAQIESTYKHEGKAAADALLKSLTKNNPQPSSTPSDLDAMRKALPKH